MTEAPKKSRSNIRELGGAPFPEAPRDERVEWWNQRARQSYGRAVYYLDKARRCYLDAFLKPFGLSSAHMPILTYLWEGHDGDTQSVIASVVGVDPATVTRVSQKLEELGYIERTVSERDSRALCLSLTESGWGSSRCRSTHRQHVDGEDHESSPCKSSPGDSSRSAAHHGACAGAVQVSEVVGSAVLSASALGPPARHLRA